MERNLLFISKIDPVFKDDAKGKPLFVYFEVTADSLLKQVLPDVYAKAEQRGRAKILLVHGNQIGGINAKGQRAYEQYTPDVVFCCFPDAVRRCRPDLPIVGYAMKETLFANPQKYGRVMFIQFE